MDITTSTLANNTELVTQTATEAEAALFSFTIPEGTFADADKDPLTYTYTATLEGGSELPTWLAFDAVTKTFSGIPPTADDVNVFVSVTDGKSDPVSSSFKLDVAAKPNQVPEVSLIGIAAQTATQGSAFSFTIPEGTFADVDPLTYTATLADGSTLPAWLAFDAVTKTFSGIPPAADDVNVSVFATDGKSDPVSSSFQLKTTALINPSKPVLDPKDIARGFGISVASKKDNQRVNEIGLFVVDDNGKVGGFDRGDAGYMKAALDRSVSISTSLNGSFFTKDKQEIGLDSTKEYRFIKVEDGSLSEAKYQLDNGKTPTNVLFLSQGTSGNNSYVAEPTDNGYRVSINNDDLVLNVTKLEGDLPIKPIGSKSQGSYEGRTIDLKDPALSQKLTASITTKSDAAYDNHIGFYAVEDELGTILVNGKPMLTSNTQYAIEAVKIAMANSLQAGKNETKTNLTIDSGKIFAPVVISQGTLESFSKLNPTNIGGANQVNAYFNYIGANSDKMDHFRLLGANTFGVEDIYGGGDKDFNDLTIKMTITAA